jgi:hypothetical protein
MIIHQIWLDPDSSLVSVTAELALHEQNEDMIKQHTLSLLAENLRSLSVDQEMLDWFIENDLIPESQQEALGMALNASFGRLW